ncbi:endonuclease domain of the non-LTR retrotransposon LINE-1 [Elysia marginata]|uniref:Endonuclease domain of the non-LTR retrotransposon LINE-1 n=1 Tax=Elysia marginata TaxID=1093978 RepID=A0AAV4HZQ9_9GAST|nr:endonuclease domain of the non-LTR retrotransposon LINE-1 [Elysia marginata]
MLKPPNASPQGMPLISCHHEHTYKTNKKTRRKKRGGRRKQRKVVAVWNVFARHNNNAPSHYNSGNYEQYKNRVVNQNNLTEVNTKDIFRDESCNKNIRIGYINAQSIRQKTAELKDIVEEYDIDIMVITETWMRAQGYDHYITQLTPPDYTFKSYPRKDRVGGGLGFLY